MLLKEAAKAVIENWEDGDLAGAVNYLRESLESQEEEKAKSPAGVLERARELYALNSNDDIEIDDDAAYSRSDYGTWVQAWVHVADAEMGITEDDDDAAHGESGEGPQEGEANDPGQTQGAKRIAL